MAPCTRHDKARRRCGHFRRACGMGGRGAVGVGGAWQDLAGALGTHPACALPQLSSTSDRQAGVLVLVVEWLGKAFIGAAHAITSLINTVGCGM